jgi:putative Ca2+/H+ antiporter (TMEM165/GDT1 family)
VDVLAGLSAFAVIFPAELPDKTAVATLVLSARYRPAPVVVGVWLAFAVHVVFACAVGRAVSLLPHRLVDGVSGAIFLIAGVVLLRGANRELAEEEAEGVKDAVRAPAVRSSRSIALAAFGVVFLAEWGDFTQIATANLAARSGEPVSTGVGALVALWAVALLAATLGRSLLRVVPLERVRQVAGAVCLGFACYAGVLVATA